MTRLPDQHFKSLARLKIQKRKCFKASILVRCLNEISAIERFYKSISEQSIYNDLELIFLDSGSTDGTLDFLLQKNINLYSISKEEFSFSKTCNLLLSLSTTEHNFFFSAHVYIPNQKTLEEALLPEHQNYPAKYFRQVVNEHTGYNFYEKAFLKKAFPATPRIFDKTNTRQLYFSNAASYISKPAWLNQPFPETIASEDRLWAQLIIASGQKIQYLSNLPVEHSHDETPEQVQKRVSINKLSQYGIRPKPATAALKFFGVFLAMTATGAPITKAYLYACSHAKAYL